MEESASVIFASGTGAGVRATLVVLVAVLIGAGCGDDCSCSLEERDGLIDVEFAVAYGPATVVACFGTCNEAVHESGRLQSVATVGFADGWESGRIAIEVIDVDGRVLTAFSAEPELGENCCGDFWRIEEPAG